MSEIVSEPKFKVGDLVILNEAERPCGGMVCVVVRSQSSGEVVNYSVMYLNADPDFDPFCNSPMRSSLTEATLVKDFGVEFRMSGSEHDGGNPYYWFKKIGVSKAKYKDGMPRDWQEGVFHEHELRRSTIQYLKLNAVIIPTREADEGQEESMIEEFKIEATAQELGDRTAASARRVMVRQLAERLFVAEWPAARQSENASIAEAAFNAAEAFITEAERREIKAQGEVM